ncbi:MULTISPECIES: ESX secretion-associated protein EspG [Actinoalloteichus]|uniref:ESX secretion-associated protein EspG n=1 Tax=Actinoalloteichus TaxID=65496 RepID=UPI0018DE0871|nr:MULTISPECIES: ESX secretion-associated protein EspG [Actinoalloteichus]
MDVRGRITLSALEVDSILTTLKTALPTAFQFLGFGDTEDERRQLHRQAWQGLERKGLVERGELHPFLVNAFRVLARPTQSIWAFIQLGGMEEIDAVIAASGEFAVLAAHHGHKDRHPHDRDLNLDPVRGSGLPWAAAGLLPEHQAGPGRSVNCSSAEIEAAGKLIGRDSGAARNAFIQSGIRPADADMLATVLSARRVRFGEFSARSFDQLSGRTRKSEFRADILDTVAGRYLLQHKPDRSGGRWFTMTPTDRSRFAGQLDEVLQSVAPRRR